MKRFLVLLALAVSGGIYAQNGTADASDGWVLSADDANGQYVGAPVANGRIGILPWREPFSVNYVILNHVFDADGPEGISRMLRGINPFGLEMRIDGEKVAMQGISGWSQTLDMREASHNTSFEVPGKAEVSYSIYALRNLPYSGLVTVRVKALDDIFIQMDNVVSVPDEYQEPGHRVYRTNIDGMPLDIHRTEALSLYREQKVSASSAFIYGTGTASLAEGGNVLVSKVKKGDVVEFALAGTVCSGRDFLDPYNESDRQITYIVKEGVDKVLEGHRALWNEMWQGDIVIEGDDKAQKDVRFSLYNLYSYCRKGSRLSISPMGLFSQGYNGHIFWDTEIWMYPPMLFLNRGIAESMIDYRTDRLGAARHRADNYGYEGAMFPWESDDAGQEACPLYAPTGAFEHHITADIAIAAWNFYCMNRDREWLKKEGWPLIREAAEFWTSRVHRNDDGSYSILNVVAADEYAEGVDDNSFTNGAAIKALTAATKAAAVCGEKAPAIWKEIADNIRILEFEDGVTREYDGYDGGIIKQADANLLAYPLGIITDPKEIRKDLEYYIGRIDDNAPAMSHSVFCVQYARLGDGERAYELFRRSYEPNSKPPFGVITETPFSDNPYFATGAGGMLQAVINGFCGLEITDKGVVQLPAALPPHWKSVTVKGVGPEMKTYVNTGLRQK